MTQETTAVTLTNSQVTPSTDQVSTKDSVMSFVPLIVIFVIFYFFIIRPQVKKQKEQQSLIKSAKKGDKVTAAGGLIGKIVKEKENDIISLEISKDTQIDILKSSIMSIIK